MSNKGSDINVSSIEEDIKILQELMEDVELTFAGWVDILNEREKKALKNLIQDYTRQKQINEEHQKENGLLREKVKELEEQVEYDKTHIFTPQTIKLNFIPKQMVIDKMKENKQILAKTNDGNLRERLYIENGIMKELLEGEK